MSDQAPPELEQRLAALESTLRDLRARVAALEIRVRDLPEHPVDRTATRKKAVYDWQGPR